MVGEKSISGGLNKWARAMRIKNKDGNYMYDDHEGAYGRGAATAAAATAEALRNPIGILNRSAAPLQNIVEYEIE
jgi:hypothetical protein